MPQVSMSANAAQASLGLPGHSHASGTQVGSSGGQDGHTQAVPVEPAPQSQAQGGQVSPSAQGSQAQVQVTPPPPQPVRNRAVAPA